MTNIDHAAEVLWENAGRTVFGTSVAKHGGWDDLSGTARLPFTSAARALHKEGLLMPDLPEPDGRDADGLPYWGEGDYNTALTWHPCDRDVPRNERPLLIHSPISPWMHPDELEAEGLRALAAARAARQALKEASDAVD